jgi:hypothetical protein
MVLKQSGLVRGAYRRRQRITYHFGSRVPVHELSGESGLPRPIGSTVGGSPKTCRWAPLVLMLRSHRFSSAELPPWVDCACSGSQAADIRRGRVRRCLRELQRTAAPALTPMTGMSPSPGTGRTTLTDRNGGDMRLSLRTEAVIRVGTRRTMSSRGRFRGGNGR